MKQSKIINAYKIIDKISDNKLNLHTSYQIYKIKNSLKDIYQFQLQEEKKLIEEYNVVIDDGKLKFNTPEIASEFLDKLNEIGDNECDIDIVPVEIDSNENILLSIREIEQLEGFIDIK